MTARRRTQRSSAVLLLAGLVALAAGCGNTPSELAPNQIPITEITGGPADGSRTPSRVPFFFRGSDYDGTVRDFDYIVDTYPRSVETIDQITLQVPPVNDPRWQRITAYQLELTVLADTLRADPRGPIGEGEFDRWHTFYVRAVDNEGAMDTSPDMRTFQGFTQAPTLDLLLPARAGETVTLPRTFVMNWDGFDPIGNGEPYQSPLEVRWVIRPAVLDGGGAPIGFPDALYDLPDSAWSPWIAWAAPDSSGREKALVNVVPQGPNQAGFVFAIQGRDDAGAITPQFDRDTPGSNNYASITVDGSLPVGPIVTVRAMEDAAVEWKFTGTDAPQIDVTTALDTLTLFWDPPDASAYGARARESRYGWNIVNENDDEEWTAWSTNRFAPPHVLASNDIFHVQARDEIGQVTTGRVVFTHMSGARRPGVP